MERPLDRGVPYDRAFGRTIVYCARVAQRLEHRSCKAGVVGSIPTSGSAALGRRSRMYCGGKNESGSTRSE